jgi:hypothetical protein
VRGIVRNCIVEQLPYSLTHSAETDYRDRWLLHVRLTPRFALGVMWSASLVMDDDECDLQIR